MNSAIQKYRPVRDAIYLTVMVTTLTIGTLFSSTAIAADADGEGWLTQPFEVMVHKSDVYGARDIESGNYAKGIERLLARLGNENQAYSKRTPILIDLCVGYTMLEDYAEATKYCDDAVSAGWYAGLALNNRGALKIAMGEYESAIDDFSAALRENGADAMAGRNIQRTVAKMAAISAKRDAAVAKVMDSDQ